MTDCLSEWCCGEMVPGKAHCQCPHVVVRLNPLTLVLEHAAARSCAVQSEGITSNSAQEFWEDG